eukprot:scaffold9542_cov100-Skeletonema_dohrnii-CCMP3373.AAC.4
MLPCARYLAFNDKKVAKIFPRIFQSTKFLSQIFGSCMQTNFAPGLGGGCDEVPLSLAEAATTYHLPAEQMFSL